MLTLIDKFIDATIPNEASWKAYLRGVAFIVLIVMVVYLSKALGYSENLTWDFSGVNVEISKLTLIFLGIIWIDANLFIRKYQKGELNLRYDVVALILAFMVICATIVHELGHALMTIVFDEKIQIVGISWWGAFVQPVKDLAQTPPGEQIAIALAGPLTNFLLYMVAKQYVIREKESIVENSMQYFAYINYLFAMYNCIPFVVNTDGGKVLHGVLRLIGVQPQWLEPLTFVVGLFIFLFYILFRIGSNAKSMKDTLASL